MINTLNTALSGLQNASQRVNSAANNIANVGHDPNVDLAEEIINLKLAETQFKANLITIEAANELSKETLRIFDERV